MTLPDETTISIPPLESHLPDLMPFINQLVEDVERAKLHGWTPVTECVQSFFTPSMMDRFNHIAPGWQEMSSYAEGMTLTHVMLVFAGLIRCQEYLNLSDQHKTIMKWSVLFHDVGKKIINGRGDFIHGFRSAVVIAQQLPRLGFATSPDYDTYIEDWSTLTTNAIVMPKAFDQPIQDNRKLPAILSGIDQLFGHNTPESLIVKIVLLHMSITLVSTWPQAAPLGAKEISQYIDIDLFPLLKTMMIVDSEAWAYFDPARKARHRAEALAAFEEVRQLIVAN